MHRRCTTTTVSRNAKRIQSIPHTHIRMACLLLLIRAYHLVSRTGVSAYAHPIRMITRKSSNQLHKRDEARKALAAMFSFPAQTHTARTATDGRTARMSFLICMWIVECRLRVLASTLANVPYWRLHPFAQRPWQRQMRPTRSLSAITLRFNFELNIFMILQKWLKIFLRSWRRMTCLWCFQIMSRDHLIAWRLCIGQTEIWNAKLMDGKLGGKNMATMKVDGVCCVRERTFCRRCDKDHSGFDLAISFFVSNRMHSNYDCMSNGALQMGA